MSTKSHSNRALARSAGVIGSWTLVSRVLGFIRDVMTAHFFGTSMIAEAFVVSFKLPNLLRDLAGEGAMSAAIVPVLTETRAMQGEKEYLRLASALLYWLTGLLSVLTVLGILFAPWVVRAVAPGFVQHPEKFELTVHLTRFIFPFILFVGLSAYMMGVLHTLKNFGTSALGPAVLNLSMIVAMICFVPQWGVYALAVSILIGGALQCAVQWISLLRKNLKWMWGEHFHPGILKILKLMGPRLWGTAVYQVSVFVDTIIASFYWIVGEGGQSALYYSSRLFQLPLAIFGVSIAQAVLPTLSDHHVGKNTESYLKSLDFAMRYVIAVSVPAGFGLAFFAEPIISVLFMRGEFDHYSMTITSQALFYYSFGLLSCGLIKVLVSAFYALQDTRTPVRTATASLLVNLVFNLLLMHHLKIGGLALSTTIAATCNAVMLFVALKKRFPEHSSKGLAVTLTQSLIAGTVMAVLAFMVFSPWVMRSREAGGSGIVELGAGIAACALCYVVLMLLLGSQEIRRLLKFPSRASGE